MAVKGSIGSKNRQYKGEQQGKEFSPTMVVTNYHIPYARLSFSSILVKLLILKVDLPNSHVKFIIIIMNNILVVHSDLTLY